MKRRRHVQITSAPRAAFTLVELLVVIAIVGVLVAMLLPAVQAAREAARRSQCSNNLKQLGLGVQNYYDAKRQLPPGYLASGAYVDGASDTTPGWGWAVAALPFLEQSSVYGQIDLKLPIENANNSLAISAVLPAFLCPSDQAPSTAFKINNLSGTAIATAAPASYAACVGGDESDLSAATGAGVFYRNSGVKFAQVTDGTSKTIMIGERAWGKCEGIWAGAIKGGVIQRGPFNPCPNTGALTFPAPALSLAHSHLNSPTGDADGGLDDFGSFHAEGANFVFVDGGVHFLAAVLSDTVGGGYLPESLIFQGLGTRAGNETVPTDWLQ